jgi:hypothetical protein
MMLIIIYCLARTFLPDLAALTAEIETSAVILALGVFASIFRRCGWIR